MRWVFVCVIAMNLLYVAGAFSWAEGEGLTGAHGAAVPHGEQQYPARLVLLAESVPGYEYQPSTIIVSKMCTALGPFFDGDSASMVAGLLEKNGLSFGERKMGGAASYWVYLEPYSDRQQALRKLRELQAANIDSFVVTEGEFKNAISLGSFANRGGAVGLQLRMSSSGFAAQIKEQAGRNGQVWLVLEDAAAQGVSELIPAEMMGTVRIERKPCSESR